eukprot:4062220-Pyramimonas_sp.AAC.1
MQQLRGLAVWNPGMAVWPDSGSSRRNSQVDPWRRNPRNNVLAGFRVFKWMFSNEAFPVEINCCRNI